MSSLQTFSLFADLPTELRLLIWRAARPGPRNIELRWNNNTRQWSSTANPPAILHVNQESRAEGLKDYALWFDGASPPDSQLDDSKEASSSDQSDDYPIRTVYFDNTIDTAYLTINTFDHAAIDSFSADNHSYDFLELKSLAIDFAYFHPSYRIPGIEDSSVQFKPRPWPQLPYPFDNASIFQLSGSSLETLRIIRDRRTYNPEDMVLEAEARWQIERCTMARIWEVLQLYTDDQYGGSYWPNFSALENWKCRGLLVDGCPVFEEIRDGAAWTNEIYVGDEERFRESDAFYDIQAWEEEVLVFGGSDDSEDQDEL